MLLVACAAPATTWDERIEPDARFRDQAYEAVVRVGRHCSGTLIAPRQVLTAAHCLPTRGRGPGAYGAELPRIRVGDERYRSVTCDVHPGAYGVRRCQDRPEASVESRHDLALLGLARDVPIPPIPMRLRTSPLPAHLWLVGWHRRPPTHGVLRRYAGRSRVVSASSTLVMRSEAATESGAFATRNGNSGGPALLHEVDGLRVVGVLSRHTASLPRRSIYALLSDNEAWVRSATDSSRRSTPAPSVP
ncbi:MAG: trypsin-like serine protease [Myxococcota bacterium]